jgi:DnaK suppressor protein
MKEHDRKKLIIQVAQRIAELEMTISSDEPLAIKKQSGDAVANMDLNIQESVNNKLMQDHKKELSQLRRNLVWMDSDNAGYCEQCDNEVPIARLMAVLNSRLCLSCAEKNTI